jgi:hypothetical protein
MVGPHHLAYQAYMALRMRRRRQRADTPEGEMIS